jgi:SNF2 family DNA or RNA helicase
MMCSPMPLLYAMLAWGVAQVVFCKLSPLQLKLYNAFLSSKPVQALLASTATDPESKAAAKAKRKSAKVSKAAAAAATQAAAGMLTQAPAVTAADGVAGDDADENFQQLRATAGSRRTSASAAAPGSRPVSTSAAALSISSHQQQQQQQQQQPEEAEEDAPQQQSTAKEDALAPLVAITALKKLCCHPDLIWEMLNKHKVQAKQKAQQQVGAASSKVLEALLVVVNSTCSKSPQGCFNHNTPGSLTSMLARKRVAFENKAVFVALAAVMLSCCTGAARDDAGTAAPVITRSQCEVLRSTSSRL